VIEELIRLQLPYLPIALLKIVKATDVLLGEALGFAISIMGRNLDLVTTLLHRILENKIEIIGFYPLHLAASFLSILKSHTSTIPSAIDTNRSSIFLKYCQEYRLKNAAAIASHVLVSPFNSPPVDAMMRISSGYW
jgi:hypothetical protein